MPLTLDVLLPPPAVAIALIVGLAFPLWLFMTRFIPVVAGDVSRRYLAACALAFAVWSTAVFLLGPPLTSDQALSGTVNGALVLLSGFVFFLGLWGLLTRGCSVSILIAHRRLQGRASAANLGAAYSANRGLRWLADKRINSLVHAGLAIRAGGVLRIARPKGTLAAFATELLLRIIGLKTFG